MLSIFKPFIDRCMNVLRSKTEQKNSPPTQPTAAPGPQAGNHEQPRVVQMNITSVKSNPIEDLVKRCRETAFTIGLKTPPGEPIEPIEKRLLDGATAEAQKLSLSPEAFELREKQSVRELAILAERQKVQLVNSATAHGNVRRLRDKLAKLLNNPYPTAGSTVRWGSVLGIALSLAPAIHDFIPGLPEILRWTTAFGFSSLFGAILVAVILPPEQATLEKSGRGAENLRRLAVGAGVIVGGSFLVIRLTKARTLTDYMLVIAGAALEIGLVLLLEYTAKTLVPKIEAWRETEVARRSTESALEAATLEAKHRDDEVAKTKAEQAGIEHERLENATLRNEERLINIAKRATSGGLQAGLTERSSHDNGCPLPPETEANNHKPNNSDEDDADSKGVAA